MSKKSRKAEKKEGKRLTGMSRGVLSATGYI